MMADASGNPIPTDTGFDGYPAEWYYLDKSKGALSRSLPASAQMSSAATPHVSIAPRYLNAPSTAVGSNAKTQFKGQGKPNAYLKVQLTQDQADPSATNAMTWAALYPVIDNPTTISPPSTSVIRFRATP